MEAAATSVTIKWGQRLVDAFSAYETYVLVGLRRQGKLTEKVVSMRKMELTVRGLKSNTEYELLIDVITQENPKADSFTIRILAGNIRTKYYCKNASGFVNIFRLIRIL